jgi:virginiamycin B lyase
MTTLNMHPGTPVRGLRRAVLQAASDFLTARARRRPADRVRALPRLEGLEDRCLLTPTVTEYTVPTAGALSSANRNAITAGPDGNLWFTEYHASQIGMINPTTHAFNEFATLTANADPQGITAGPDGNIWFTEGIGIGMINPANDHINEFPAPSGDYLWGITAGPDGNLWFTDRGAGNPKVGMINPTTHVINEFPVPSGGYPLGICAGPDGNLWFTEPNGNKIGMINPATHVINEFPVPSVVAPGGICAGPDGNLWFTEGAGNIGMITTTGTITEFPDSTNSAYPTRICAGPDGNIWFAEAAGNIAMFNPATPQAVTRYPIPYAGAGAWAITAGPDSNIWFADADNAIGLVALYQTSSTHLVITQQPPSSVTAGSLFGLTVTAEDSSGNPITSFNGAVTVGLANNPGGATLGGTLTATASNGVATFSGLSLTKPAIGYTLDVYASGLGGVVSSAVTVTPLAPSQLVITQQPSATATAGQPFATQPVVYEEDAYGNVETGDNSTVVTAALASGAGPLQGTTAVTVSGGVATFTNLADNKAETLTLQFSGGGFTSVPSSSIVVSPAAAVKLAITTQPPASVVVNAGFGFTAAVEDAYGNVVTSWPASASNSVSVALASNPTGARLSGTSKVTASHGLATFTGLSLNKVGTGYTLQVTSKGLTAATTSPFNVVSSATSSALAATTTTTPPNPLLAPLVLDSPDLWDGLGFKKHSRRA